MIEALGKAFAILDARVFLLEGEMHAIVETINQAELLELIRNDALLDALLIARREGWHLKVTPGPGERTLAGAAGDAQVFPTLETAAVLLHSLGVTEFRVDSSAARLDQELAYDAWFRQQVQDCLDDASPTITHAAVEEQFAAKRAALKRKMAGG